MPDGEVTFRHRGVDHHAEVRGSEIVLRDGRAFDNPTGAAQALNGNVPVNGWRAWTRDGRSIADIVDRRT